MLRFPHSTGLLPKSEQGALFRWYHALRAVKASALEDSSLGTFASGMLSASSIGGGRFVSFGE